MATRRWAARGRKQLAAAALVVLAWPCGAAPSPEAEGAYRDFLEAADEQAQLVKSVRAALPVKRRLAFSQAQTAWLTWRTRACAFEATGVEAGAAGAAQWQCALRLTQERSEALRALGH